MNFDTRLRRAVSIIRGRLESIDEIEEQLNERAMAVRNLELSWSEAEKDVYEIAAERDAALSALEELADMAGDEDVYSVEDVEVVVEETIDITEEVIVEGAVVEEDNATVEEADKPTSDG